MHMESFLKQPLISVAVLEGSGQEVFRTEPLHWEPFDSSSPVSSCYLPWTFHSDSCITYSAIVSNPMALSRCTVLCYHYECVHMADTRHVSFWGQVPLNHFLRSSWNEGTSVLFETTVQPLTAQNNPVWLTLLSESLRNTFTSSSYNTAFIWTSVILPEQILNLHLYHSQLT